MTMTRDTNVEQLAEQVEKLTETVEQQAERIEELEQYKQETEPVVQALRKGLKSANARITELQNRELEKGAHLREENIAEEDIDVDAGEIERFLKDGDYYYRTIGADDPLENGSSATVEYADLLPIQQLARGSEETLAREKQPVQFAAKLWADKEKWKDGSGEVNRYVDAGDVARWIRHEGDGISREYSQKLARRTFEVMIELAKGRIFTRKVSHQRDGITYKETRLVLPTRSEIPGEQTARDGKALKTNGVPG